LSQIFIKRGTWITSHVLNVAGFFQPVAVSHFSHGGVSITSKLQVGSSSILIGFHSNSCKITLSQSIKNNSAQSSIFFHSSTCSNVELFIKT
jgi:hypothetical protein